MISKLIAWTGFKGKTLWDWLKLLIIPLTLFVASMLLNDAQNQRQQQLEDNRAAVQATVEADRANANALQAYYDKMSELLLERQLRSSERGSEARSVALATTLATLRGLDSERKGSLLEFLHQSGLIGFLGTEDRQKSIIILDGADLSGADLSGTNLLMADLDGAILREADLSGALLDGTFLANADLSGADLSGVSIWQASLDSADLREADLSGANLSEANLSGADLTGTIFIGVAQGGITTADLTGATYDEETVWPVDFDPEAAGAALDE